MIRIFARSLLFAGILAGIASLGAGRAEAGFIATFAGQSTGAFSYTLDFTAGAGSTETLVSGNQVTIYDFNPGTVGAMPVVTLTGAALANFTVSEQLLTTPPAGTGTVPIIPDSPTLYNVTFTYNGTAGNPLSMATSFAGISIATTLTGRGFASTIGNDQKSNGTPVGTSGTVVVPSAVPEPASIALLGLGGVVGLVLRRKSRVAIA